MDTTDLTLDEIRTLAQTCLRQNGMDEPNADALSEVLMRAQQDGSLSHGLFRLPAYVAALRSGKMNGRARPTLTRPTPALVKVHGDNGCAPHAHRLGIPAVVSAAREVGVAAAAFTHIHHMAALWHEVEAVAEAGLAAITCTAYMSAVAPAGGAQAFFGTNPIAFAFPRPNDTPVVFDMATAAMAKGEIQIAARDGHAVPAGTGLDKDGQPTTDAAKIIDGGVILPFGGYKGSALALMVELLAAGLVGEQFSFEASASDNGDGGPPQGGQLLIAMSPARIAGSGWEAHCADFFARLGSMDGVRLPGARRHRNRQDASLRAINTALLTKIRALTDSDSH